MTLISPNFFAQTPRRYRSVLGGVNIPVKQFFGVCFLVGTKSKWWMDRDERTYYLCLLCLSMCGGSDTELSELSKAFIAISSTPCDEKNQSVRSHIVGKRRRGDLTLESRTSTSHHNQRRQVIDGAKAFIPTTQLPHTKSQTKPASLKMFLFLFHCFILTLWTR